MTTVRSPSDDESMFTSGSWGRPYSWRSPQRNRVLRTSVALQRPAFYCWCRNDENGVGCCWFHCFRLAIWLLGTPTLCRRHPSVNTSMLHHKDKARESIQRHWLALYRNIIRIRGCVVTSVFNNLLSLGRFDLAWPVWHSATTLLLAAVLASSGFVVSSVLHGPALEFGLGCFAGLSTTVSSETRLARFAAAVPLPCGTNYRGKSARNSTGNGKDHLGEGGSILPAYRRH